MRQSVIQVWVSFDVREEETIMQPLENPEHPQFPGCINHDVILLRHLRYETSRPGGGVSSEIEERIT